MTAQPTLADAPVTLQRVAEKAGFVLEGVQRARLAQRGERRDCWVAGLLPGDLG